MKSLILVLLVLLSLSACSSNSHKASPPHDKQVIQKSIDESIEFDAVIQLLNTLNSDKIRQNGLIKLIQLHDELGNRKTIPLKTIVDFFNNLIKNHPLQKTDDLLLKLSDIFSSSNSAVALYYLDTLLVEYPQTHNVDVIQFKRGELLFKQYKYTKSELAFIKVITFRQNEKKSAQYSRAVFNAGRAQFEQNNYKAALNSYFHLLDLYVTKKEFSAHSSDINEREFVEQVKQAINLAFDYSGGPTSVRDFFSNQYKRDYEYLIYQSLALYYKNKNEILDVIKTYQLFVSSNQTHIESPGFLLDIIRALEEGGYENLALDAKITYVQSYNINHAYWGLYHNSKSIQYLSELNKYIFELAVYYNEKAKVSKNKLYYVQSQHWYQIWLYSFPADKQVWHVNNLYAQSLRDSQHYQMAALYFEHLAYDYPLKEASSNAAYEALKMYQEREKQLSGFEKRQWQYRMAYSVNRFITHYPDAARKIKSIPNKEIVIDNSINAITQLIGSRQWSQADLAIREFIKNEPSHTLVPYLTENLAVINLLTKEYKKSSAAFERLAYKNISFFEKLTAHWQSTEISGLLDADDTTERLYINFINRFSSKPQYAVLVGQNLIDLYKRQGEKKKVNDWRIKLANLDAQAGESRSAFTRGHAAKLSYYLAEPLFEYYRRANLNLPLDESMKIKSQKMDLAINAYRRAVSYKVPSILTISTYRIAELYEDFSVSIRHSQKPVNYNQLQRDKYDAELNKKASLLMAQSIKFHKINAARISSGISDIWVKKSLEKLKVNGVSEGD